MEKYFHAALCDERKTNATNEARFSYFFAPMVVWLRVNREEGAKASGGAS